MAIALACFNVVFRLGLESVGEWDESLYATTAWEMRHSGELVGTTFGGALDYYNSKPPLNVWLIAGAYHLFGVTLTSLRIPSALAAVLTVIVFYRWTSRLFGIHVGWVATGVLGTSFGYLHIHSARTGNPDALLTLLLLSIVVTLSHLPARPWLRICLGPLLGSVFLLKGMAVLQPLLLILIFETFGARHLKRRWLPLCLGLAIGAAIACGWAVLRWRVDGWEFLTRLVRTDLLALSLTQLEGHRTGPLFYVGVLQRYTYEWVLAAMVAIGLSWRGWPGRIRRMTADIRARQPVPALLVAWGVAVLAVPSLMQTRLAWYLNPFYPLFALLVGLIVVDSLSILRRSRRKTMALITATVVALILAESKSVWRLYRVTNLDTSVQGALMRHVRPQEGQRVHRDRLSRAEAFVVRAVLNAEFVVEHSLTTRPEQARPGDLVIIASERKVPGLRLLGRFDGHSVFEVE